MAVTLLEIEDRSWAEITRLPEGEAAHRLEALGIRPGKMVQRISAMPFHGPVTLSIDGRQIAIGRDIAGRISINSAQSAHCPECAIDARAKENS